MPHVHALTTGTGDYTGVVRMPSLGERPVKKGRHRRFEEARALKRSNEVVVEPCPECGADPEDEHASWCLAAEEEEELGEV